ncbi:cob(I)yrinic acid a,c-diamide adenosyltransferase [Bacillus sp. 2205SS5-2]|uniref:cob(I)yrinic acid a,c-diamide adenosyltransferase n=1 Tax=Bacillus sp. 2205SS5-2 TaxID=3109031 RepID=UPI0030060F9C
MKLYTKGGDKGKTSVIGGRVYKDDLRVEAYGTVDEINSFVGQARAQLKEKAVRDIQKDLEKIQHELFDLGGELATLNTNRPTVFSENQLNYLESRIDEYTDECPPLQRFVLPGGNEASASLHIARTVTRRGERLVVQLSKLDASTSPLALQYLNRLSDFFFAAARVVNFRTGVKDVEYIRSKDVFNSTDSDSE